MSHHPYRQAIFLKSAPTVAQLPPDEGYEVAFAGRSNAGKSSALNFLCGIRQLAKTSKTPGRTQLLNVFSLDAQHERRLIDLPGYGYAQVPVAVKMAWEKTLTKYLTTRESLRGIVLLMDCRHPLKPLDEVLIDAALYRDLSVHILLTKADKISQSQAKSTLLMVREHYQWQDSVTVQNFSVLKKIGIETLIATLNQWYGYHEEDTDD